VKPRDGLVLSSINNCAPNMTKRFTLSRRSFILSASAAGGALAVGFRLTGGSKASVEILNWIVVAPDNTVTIRIAQMEMGQGATTLAQLLAEELEVDWSLVRTEFISIARNMNREKIYGRTNTAGSEGVSGSQFLLRTAGAQIRMMLVKAAAERFAAPESELVAQGSAVTHTLTGRKFTYGELAGDAAKVPIPDPASVRLKDPKDWRYIGKSVKRLDIPMKINGTAIYGIDVKLPGMKYAAIAISPVFGGKLISYDARAALALPGVYKAVEIKGGKAGFVGGMDDGIAIVADEWWQAKKAIDALSVNWDEGKGATVDSEVILANLQTGLQGQPDEILRNDGDVEAALSSAARVLEADYFVPYLEHATMEPMNCTALVTDDRFEVWVPTQVPEWAFKTAASVAGMPINKGNLHVTQIGGGFGRRQECDYLSQAVQIAKAMKGIPIKLVWTREGTMQHGFYRPVSLSRMRGGFDADSNVSAWAHRISAPSHDRVRGQFGADSLLYAIPNMRVDFAVRRSNVPEGQMRGVGFSTHCFVTQSFVDELARVAGTDSYKFQRALLDPGRVPPIIPTGTVKGEVVAEILPKARAMRLRAVLDEVASRADWGVPLGPNRGRGIAVLEEANAFFAVVAEVTLDNKAWFRVDRVIVAGDPGFLVNPNNADAQVEGSVAFALTSAMYGEITIRNGGVVETNFNDYRMLRIDEMPKVQSYWVLSGRAWGGVSQQVVSAVPPALTNAIYDAGGPRIRSLPLKNHKIAKRESAR
jgi:isoquinoline 1-oxidoreductase subunit beta